MYAAAGGASLASRQARQRQRQQKKTQLLQAKLHPPKAPGLAVHGDHGIATPTRHSRQFHQLPTNYLRTPQAQVRKLSAGYTAQSKLLLPIDEGGDTESIFHMRTHSHVHEHAHGHITIHGHSHTHQQHHQHSHLAHYTGLPIIHQHQHGRISPRLGHRYSGSNGSNVQQTNLPKSASATIPLVLQFQETTPPPPPPPPKTQDDLLSDAAAERQPLTKHIDTYEGDTDDENKEYQQQQRQHQQQLPPTGQLERKCSVYRMKELDGSTISGGVKRQWKELQFSSQQNQRYEPLLSDEPQMIFKGLPPPSLTTGRKAQICAYCEEGICTCEHIECAQGRAAWLERGRRCSVQETQQQAACHRRWVKRNRIQDASLGGSSDDEDILGVLRGPSTFANTFLYVGLGTIALGLVIAFVGTGEKGFKTVELRLIGPSLIGLGFICCMLRILFCICPSHCLASSKKDMRQKTFGKLDADHTTSLLRSENKRVSIARGAHHSQRYPFSHKRTNTKMLNEGMEALRQIATTSLFMQNEQKLLTTNRIVPIIKEPDNINGPPLEMKKLDSIMKSGVEQNVLTKVRESTSNPSDHQLNQMDSAMRDKENMEKTTASVDALTLQSNTCNTIVKVDNVTDSSDGYITSNNTLVLGHQEKQQRQHQSHNEQQQQQQQQQQQLVINHINTAESPLSHLPSRSSEVQNANRNHIETSLTKTEKYHFDKTIQSPSSITLTRATANATASKSCMTSSTADIPIHKPNVLKSSALTEEKLLEMTKNHVADLYSTRNKNLIVKYPSTSIRGPLGMPRHLLNTIKPATIETTAASATITKSNDSRITLYNSNLPISSNNLDVLRTSKLITTVQENLPGQVEDDNINKVIVKFPITTVPITATVTTVTTAVAAVGVIRTNGSSKNNLIFPTSSSIDYLDSTSSLSLNKPNKNDSNTNVVYTTSFTTISISSPTTGKMEPELLLSPAKLGR